MPRRTLIFDAPAEAVEAALHDALRLETVARLVLGRVEAGTTTTLVLETAPLPNVPYFGWFVVPATALGARRASRFVVDHVTAVLAGHDPPRAPRALPMAAPVDFDPKQATLLATAAAIAAIGEFGASLFNQFVDYVGRSYGASDRALGVSLAVTRAGVVIALIAAAAADRRGRRRLLLLAVLGIAFGNAVSALAPTLAVFTFGQLVVRGFVNVVVALTAVVAIEGAPEGARAYSVGMLALAGGAGYAISVVLLPFADLAANAWRVAFMVSAASALLIPSLGRNLVENDRYQALARRTSNRGRVREVLDSKYARRFLVLAVMGFLFNVFVAPVSQLGNRYLQHDRHFSGLGVSVLTAITTGLPAFLGLAVGSRLAETRGRRPLAIVASFVGTVSTMIFFVTTGLSLWVMSTVGGVMTGAGAPALGAFNSELFPTEVRGTAGGLLTMTGVAGSVVGLLAAGVLSDHLGLGLSIALLGIPCAIASVTLIPLLPEPASRLLDDVSPPEV